MTWEAWFTLASAATIVLLARDIIAPPRPCWPRRSRSCWSASSHRGGVRRVRQSRPGHRCRALYPGAGGGEDRPDAAPRPRSARTRHAAARRTLDPAAPALAAAIRISQQYPDRRDAPPRVTDWADRNHESPPATSCRSRSPSSSAGSPPRSGRPPTSWSSGLLEKEGQRPMGLFEIAPHRPAGRPGRWAGADPAGPHPAATPENRRGRTWARTSGSSSVNMDVVAGGPLDGRKRRGRRDCAS